MIRHTQLKLSTAQRMANSSREEQNRIKRVLDFRSVKELRDELTKMESEGYTVIPAEGCEHDGTGACPGHEEDI